MKRDIHYLSLLSRRAWPSKKKIPRKAREETLREQAPPHSSPPRLQTKRKFLDVDTVKPKIEASGSLKRQKQATSAKLSSTSALPAAVRRLAEIFLAIIFLCTLIISPRLIIFYLSGRPP